MKVTFVIVSVSDRVHELNELLRSLASFPKWREFDVCLLFQDPDGVSGKIVTPPGVTLHLWRALEKLGCHGARVQLLRRIHEASKDPSRGIGPYDAYVNLDDDMLIVPETDYSPAIEKALLRDVGFVMTNWARTPGLLAKKVPAMMEVRATGRSFTKQIMLYNGGGMAYSEKIAALMRELPPVKTAFDCAWPITSYVNGYTNYVFRGSLAVHRVCGMGGMKTFMKETPLHVMCQEWLRFKPALRRKGNCQDVLIPLDADVLPAAKAEHARMREILMRSDA